MSFIESIIRKINGGVFASVDYETPKHGLLKTSKVDGTTNPFWSQKDQIVKVVTDCQINLGVVYENAVNGRLEKKDITPDFESAPNWMVAHTEPHKNLCQNKDHSKTYVRYMPMGNGNMTVRYMLNGQDVTDQVRKFRKVQPSASRQETAGLEKDEQIVWRVLDLANITALRVLGMEVTQ
jgi:hypothetical protein